MGQLEELRAAIVDGQNATALAKVNEALASGLPPEQILQEGLIAAMGETGALYQAGDIFVPEMLVAARAMSAALGVLKPHLVAEGIPSRAKVVIGTVQGDLHDIGKNLVAMMLKGADMDVIDLGVNVSADKFVEAINQHSPDLVGLSALLTTTMPAIKNTVDAIHKATGRKVKIMIGGAPITQQFADEIGADAYATDAASAVDVAQKLLG